MDNENKGLPDGWGDNSEDDDEYGFVDDIDDEDDDNSESVWENRSSPFKKSEPVTFPDTNNKTVIPDADNEADIDLGQKTPVQEVKQPENIPAPPVNPPQSQGYVTQKTNPVLIIIIVLVLVIGVLSGMFFIMSRNNNDKSDNSDESIPVSDTEKQVDSMATTDIEEPTDNKSTADIEEVTTESEVHTMATTFTTKILTKETTAATKPEKPTVSSDEINNAAKQALNDFMKNNAVQSPKYSLYDVNGDGISELFITYMAISGDSNYILYYYDASKFSESEQFWGGLSICPDNHYLKETNYGGAEVYKYYQLNEENQLSKFDEIYSSPDGKYYRNGQEIFNSEYYAAIYYYNDMNWIDIESSSINIALTETYAFYGIVATESDALNLREKPSTDSKVVTQLPKGSKVNVYYVDNYSDWYKIYAENGYEGYVSAKYIKEYNEAETEVQSYNTYDTSAAGSDFSFFNEPYSRKIITERDPLNLRAAPSTSAEIIIKMPKGSPVTLYGSNGGGLFADLDNNSEWSYISYTENGIIYYGYASSEFIGLP